MKIQIPTWIGVVVALAIAIPSSLHGAAAIFSGSDVKILKSNLSFNGGAKINTGTVDPSSVATAGGIGDLYINTSSGTIYRKTDAGTTTNWATLNVIVDNVTIENVGGLRVKDAGISAAKLGVSLVLPGSPSAAGSFTATTYLQPGGSSGPRIAAFADNKTITIQKGDGTGSALPAVVAPTGLGTSGLKIVAGVCEFGGPTLTRGYGISSCSTTGIAGGDAANFGVAFADAPVCTANYTTIIGGGVESLRVEESTTKVNFICNGAVCTTAGVKISFTCVGQRGSE